jgi:hypothetical protein
MFKPIMKPTLFLSRLAVVSLGLFVAGLAANASLALLFVPLVAALTAQALLIGMNDYTARQARRIRVRAIGSHRLPLAA